MVLFESIIIQLFGTYWVRGFILVKKFLWVCSKRFQIFFALSKSNLCSCCYFDQQKSNFIFALLVVIYLTLHLSIWQMFLSKGHSGYTYLHCISYVCSPGIQYMIGAGTPFTIVLTMYWRSTLSLFYLGIKAAGLNATLHTCPTNHLRQLPIFISSWPRLCWLKLEETAPPQSSLNPLPAEATRGPTATCICVPLRSACTPSACIILCLQTGCQGLIRHMFPGLQVRGKCMVFVFVYDCRGKNFKPLKKKN